MTMVDAILQAYERHAEHLMEELPDRTPISLLVNFRLGELRALKRMKASGGSVELRAQIDEHRMEPYPGE